VATAARDLDLFVAHDAAAPKPAWLQAYQATNDFVKVGGRKLALFSKWVKEGEQIRITGNVDQSQDAGPALNFILFARAAGYSNAKK
jgi:beta-galactosidase